MAYYHGRTKGSFKLIYLKEIHGCNNADALKN